MVEPPFFSPFRVQWIMGNGLRPLLLFSLHDNDRLRYSDHFYNNKDFFFSINPNFCEWGTDSDGRYGLRFTLWGRKILGSRQGKGRKGGDIGSLFYGDDDAYGYYGSNGWRRKKGDDYQGK